MTNTINTLKAMQEARPDKPATPLTRRNFPGLHSVGYQQTPGTSPDDGTLAYGIAALAVATNDELVAAAASGDHDGYVSAQSPDEQRQLMANGQLPMTYRVIRWLSRAQLEHGTKMLGWEFQRIREALEDGDHHQVAHARTFALRRQLDCMNVDEFHELVDSAWEHYDRSSKGTR